MNQKDLTKEVDLLIKFCNQFWAVLDLGFYAVTNPIMPDMTDCPDAAKEIEQNVKEARKEMKREVSNDRNQCDDYND
jgi:hypothetical protein